MRPDTPEAEWRYWYQFYFHSERGRAGLEAHRHAFCRLLWQHWSPHWAFDDATFNQTAASFDNTDFVDIVIHSYRHRFGLANGDSFFTNTFERRIVPRAGHNLPQEAPEAFAQAIVDIAKISKTL